VGGRAGVGLGLAARDALLLLPALPDRAAVSGDGAVWGDALAHWGVRLAEPGAVDTCLVSGGVRAAADSGSDVVLLPGRDPWGRLRRAGYVVAHYRVRRLPSGTTLVASDADLLGLGVRTFGGRRRLRSRVRARLTGGRTSHLTVAARLGVTPAVLQAASGVSAAGGAGPVELGAGLGPAQPAPEVPAAGGVCLALGSDPRRRAVFLLTDADRCVTGVVKAARSPDEQDRPEHEQRVLSSLHAAGLGDRLPTPRGVGLAGPVAWSAESAVLGRALPEVLAGAEPAEALALLGQLADWLGDLAAATAGPASRAPLPLRGERARGLASLADRLAAVPGVLTHGDLASAQNVLVTAAGAPVVLDWETAREGGPPLLDLLPLLCTGLTVARGVLEPADQARHVLSLCRGDEPESGWLRAQVTAYLGRLGLPPAAAGPLAALTWGYQASMRAVHDELLAAAGLPVPAWVSPAELLLPAWLDDPRLGTDWEALTGP
jgi:hypothetical protein